MSTISVIVTSGMVGLVVGALTMFLIVIIVWRQQDKKAENRNTEELQKLIQERTEIIEKHEKNIQELDLLKDYLAFVERGADKKEGEESSNHYIQTHLQKFEKYQKMSVEKKFEFAVYYLTSQEIYLANKKSEISNKAATKLDFDSLLYKIKIEQEEEKRKISLSQIKSCQASFDILGEKEKKQALLLLRKIANHTILNSIFDSPQVKALEINKNEN